MPNDPTPLVTRLRGLLDRLVASRDLYEDDREIVCDQVAAEARELPRDGILEALDKAAGSSRKRREESLFILSQLTDVPEVVDRIGELLRDPDPQTRSWLIQTVEQARLKQFAPFLNEVMESDPDPFCRGLAIHAADTLKADENLPTLLRLAERRDDEETWRLIGALQSYATEECRPYLEEWFKNRDSESDRVIAAWGLGKLGDKEAIAYLIRMLDDPDEYGPTHSNPGESLRAAQALCDIHQWPFEWEKSYVAKTAARVTRLS